MASKLYTLFLLIVALSAVGLIYQDQWFMGVCGLISSVSGLLIEWSHTITKDN